MSVIEIRHCNDTGSFVPTRHALRKGTPRATSAVVRAKLVHTGHGGRRIELLLTALVLTALDWKEGGHVKVAARADADALILRLTPSHAGPRVVRHQVRSATCRICVSGDFIAGSACAPVRSVPFGEQDGALLVRLPLDWTHGPALLAPAASDGRKADAVAEVAP